MKRKQKLTTAVGAPEIYPYYPRQALGMMGGLKGAAEYETMIAKPGMGARGMDAQSMAHLLIVCFIILGNVGFVMHKVRTRGAAAGHDGGDGAGGDGAVRRGQPGA